MGAASVMMTSQYLISLTSFATDPARLGAQVISGIGFVGAGTIMVTKRRQVKGLTTAAGLWDASIIGLAIGVGFYEAGVYATLLILAVELILSKLDWFLISNAKLINVYVEYETPENLTNILAMIKTKGARVLDIEITKNKLESDVHISAIISLQLEKRGQNGEVLNLLSRGEGVRAVEEL
jgi:putative Mg2+ transporter-C (MgtC) family protein